jgi:menaquinone-dependent protoporphyrinogen oxidase
MKIVIAAASKHGGTREIARVIGEELHALGLVADLREVEEIDDLDGYDAAIVGSAVYAGNWLPGARRLIARHRARLATMPVWLFSSGPIGATPRAGDEPHGLAGMLAEAGAREHVVFTGKLDPRDLGVAERLIARVVHAPAGDFRDWAAIRAWARAIGAALGAGGVAQPRG